MKKKIKNFLNEWWKSFIEMAEMEARMKSGYWM